VRPPITNLTRAGETFCIGAVEFGLRGVPVVTKKRRAPAGIRSRPKCPPRTWCGS